ncbi:hypothetical protein AAG570_011159 [Ranatra chinensis]|uniref:ATP-dependent RNA helicase n=1 Tax=Ranatra chinensis TaxID=642074 RepID=A0ABD0YY51_9HEMI
MTHPQVSNLEQNFNVTQLTTVQKLSIPQLLAGKDALVRSQTGSGKTLAYAIPILQSLQGVRPKLTRDSGIRALVILPTRELALQTYECFLKLVKSYTWIVPGLLAGGEKKKSEKARLRKGINILVGTPGRVLDHALTTKVLSFHLVSWLILDEGDKLLEMGYEKDISSVEKHRDDYSSMLTLPRRQTVLLSATLTSAVERLAGLALDDPVHIDASTGEETDDFFVIPDSLTQKYVVVAPKLRLVVLASFIIRKCEVDKGSKMLVFMATQDMVDYHTNLLSTVLPKTAEFYKLHGNMLQAERVEVFKSFRNSSSGVLLCTDVAARGLDLPKVDWIVQFTAPCNAADYVHRVGRTARVGTTGSALLFLAPSEVPFLEQLNCKRIK